MDISRSVIAISGMISFPKPHHAEQWGRALAPSWGCVPVLRCALIPLGAWGSVACTHLLEFWLRSVELPILVNFLPALLFGNFCPAVIKWFGVEPVMFSEMSLKYKGILGRQWVCAVTGFITTKFTSAYWMLLHNELELKNRNQEAAPPNRGGRAAKKTRVELVCSMSCLPFDFVQADWSFILGTRSTLFTLLSADDRLSIRYWRPHLFWNGMPIMRCCASWSVPGLCAEPTWRAEPAVGNHT